MPRRLCVRHLEASSCDTVAVAVEVQRRGPVRSRRASELGIEDVFFRFSLGGPGKVLPVIGKVAVRLAAEMKTNHSANKLGARCSSAQAQTEPGEGSKLSVRRRLPTL